MSHGNDERSTERHTYTEQFIINERRQRIANLQVAMALAFCGVPILREVTSNKASDAQRQS